MKKNERLIPWLILLGSVMTFANLYYYQVLLPLFVEEFSITPAKASLTISVPTLILAFGLLVMAMLSDSYGRKIMMSISLFGSAFITIIIIFIDIFEYILFFRMVQGMLMAAYPAVAITYIQEEIQGKALGRALAFYISGAGIGGFVGRFIGGFFTDFFHWKLALGVMAVVTLLSAIVFTMFLPTSRFFVRRPFSYRNVREGLVGALSDRRLLGIYGVAFLLLGTFATSFNYLAFPLSQGPFYLSVATIGLIYIFQLVGTSGSFIGNYFVQKQKHPRLITIGIIMQILGVYLTNASNLLIFFVGLLFICIGFFLSHNLASSWVGILANSNYRSYAASYYLLFYYLGSSVMGTYGGTILVNYSWLGIVIFNILGLLLSLLLVIMVKKQIDKQKPRYSRLS